MTQQEITMEVPLALQQLVQSSNDLLRTYQTKLVQQIQEANAQMMGILKLDPEQGWRLDMERMVYVKVELPTEEVSPEA